MLKTFSFTYAIHGVIPPRCRKARTTFGNRAFITVEVKEVDSIPVAIEQHDSDGTVKRLHWYDGRLWSPYSAADAENFHKANPANSYSGNNTLSESTENANTWAASHLLVAGVVFGVEREPCYRVDRYEGKVWIGRDIYHLANTLQRNTFPADQFDAARHYADSIATAKGVQVQTRFTVLLPEALTVLNLPEVAEARRNLIARQQDAIDSRREEIAEFEAEIARLEKAGRYV